MLAIRRCLCWAENQQKKQKKTHIFVLGEIPISVGLTLEEFGLPTK